MACVCVLVWVCIVYVSNTPINAMARLDRRLNTPLRSVGSNVFRLMGVQCSLGSLYGVAASCTLTREVGVSHRNCESHTCATLDGVSALAK